MSTPTLEREASIQGRHSLTVLGRGRVDHVRKRHRGSSLLYSISNCLSRYTTPYIRCHWKTSRCSTKRVK
jgi:hypothetical protein